MGRIARCSHCKRMLGDADHQRIRIIRTGTEPFKGSTPPRDQMWALKQAAVKWVGQHDNEDYVAALHKALVGWLNYSTDSYDVTLEGLATTAWNFVLSLKSPYADTDYYDVFEEAAKAYYEAHADE